jgi:uncharacterized membrane protein YuzA (DUF378 family)
MAMLVLILVFIGGLNWGLTGLGMLLGTNLNVVNLLLGAWPIVEAIVYIIVGLAAIMILVSHLQKKCTMCTCDAPKSETPQM